MAPVWLEVLLMLRVNRRYIYELCGLHSYSPTSANYPSFEAIVKVVDVVCPLVAHMQRAGNTRPGIHESSNKAFFSLSYW